MPLSKEQQAKYMREHRGRTVIPSVIPKPDEPEDKPVIPKCSLPHCVICNPDYYQSWYKKTFSKEDEYLS